MARLPRLFRTRSWVPRKKIPLLQIWDNLVWFFFILKTVYCVFSLESPQWGDSNENTQYTFILKKVEKIPLLYLLASRYFQPSLARTIPVSNIFTWSQRCSSDWSSTVIRVNANSEQPLVGFQRNFMEILSIKGWCVYHLHLLIRWLSIVMALSWILHYI